MHFELIQLTTLFFLSQIQCDYLKRVFYSDSTPLLCTSKIECDKAKAKLNTYCSMCGIIMPVVKFLVITDQTEVVERLALSICVGPDKSNTQMCKQLINTYKKTVYEVLQETPLSEDELCHAFLECKPVTNKVLNWTIPLTNISKPTITTPKTPSPDSPSVRILHLTDIHLDLEYQPGSLANCDQPLCCRNESTSTKKDVLINNLAGQWGDYRFCDLPLWTLESMFEHISKNEKFDFIYWTGDLGPHDVWVDSKPTQLAYFEKLTELFQKYFPGKKVYSTVGNHDTEPDNLYPFSQPKSMSWLYDFIYEDWIMLGVPRSQKSNILKGGFYTFELYPGLRLFALNNVYCYAYNFWLFIDSFDPLEQLNFLVKVLQESENKGEKVHIIGHINPSGCMRSFSEAYYKIVNRYESTIIGQFFGHTHSDEFELFYDLDDKKRPVGIAYMTGSVSTYTFQNPAYRIFTIDGFYKNSTFQIMDHETMFLNISETNMKPNETPIWKKEYSAKEAYGLKSLQPSEWNELIERLWNNLEDPLFDKIYKFYSKSYDLAKSCDLNCRKSFICKFRQARSDYSIKCY
ncbi:unnamed protein product [Brachionus calyciflorus]|uniref:Sphingomyelin phosphodiesterase n=1 Tax=Brachionus calyciflorus TaxID=104777 RepID=A0A813P634_9BILA|nr:unnamed protein product [Brachionus calyciflorus]